MSLRDWAASGWIREHAATKQEVADLFAVVDRDLGDARVPRLSADWRLNITYNAALQLATLAMYAEGFRPGRERAHERAIASLEHTVGASRQVVDLVDHARRKRNQANYEVAGSTSDREADQFFKTVGPAYRRGALAEAEASGAPAGRHHTMITIGAGDARE